MAAPADSTLLANYSKQQIVKDRNYIGLNNWASYTATLPIPATKPDPAWVKSRIVSERIPQQLDSYVQRTLSYFLQDPGTQTNIRDYLNQWNDEAKETALAAQVETVIGTFMPRFAEGEVTSDQVEQWYTAHGFTVALDARGGPPLPGSRPDPMNQPM